MTTQTSATTALTDRALILLRRLDRVAPAPSREGQPVYDAPWQVRLVALTAGFIAGDTTFEEDFAARLVARLGAVTAAELDPARYYAAWLAAMETLLAEQR